MLNESSLDLKLLPQLAKSLPARIDKLKDAKIIVVGDIGLDEYVMGDVRRISPEAPVPVVEVKTSENRLGLAAFVAQNVATLGGTAQLVAVVGEDNAAAEIRERLEKSGVSSQFLIADKSRPTTRKLRVMSGHHHIVRVDFEQKQYLSGEVEARLIAQVRSLLPGADGVIIEDYAKGVFSEAAMQAIIKDTHAAGKKVFIDPNRATPARFYNGADVMTPNREEAVQLSGLDFDTLANDPQFVVKVGQALRERVQIENIVVTRGGEGLTLIGPGGSVFHMPTFARKVFDVTGAGDTVIAAMALAHLSGWSLQDACVLGNLAAGVVVGKIGCLPCYKSELLQYISELK